MQHGQELSRGELQVFQCKSLKNIKKSFLSLVESEFQLAPSGYYAGIVTVIETLDEWGTFLAHPDDFADIDGGGIARQAKTARAAALRFKVACLGKLMGDLHQVILGDAKTSGHLIDGQQVGATRRGVHEQAQ